MGMQQGGYGAGRMEMQQGGYGAGQMGMQQGGYEAGQMEMQHRQGMTTTMGYNMGEVPTGANMQQGGGLARYGLSGLQRQLVSRLSLA
eukprot:702431-Prorocentrum_minimum.AAC.1